MPSKSKAQRNFMAAAAHNPKFAKKAGVPVSVAKEFNQADKGKKFKEGGIMKKEMKAVAKKEVKGHEARMHGMKKGGKVKKYFGSGLVTSGDSTIPNNIGGTIPTSLSTSTSSTSTGSRTMPTQSNKGGASRGLERAAAMSGRDMSGKGKPTGMKKGGSCKGYAKGGGIEKKGKTKGKMV